MVTSLPSTLACSGWSTSTRPRRPADVLAGDRKGNLPGRVGDGGPSVGQQACHGGMSPGVLAARANRRQHGKHRLVGRRRSGRRGLDGPQLQVGRLQRPRDPGGAGRPETVGQRAPGVAAGDRVGPSDPVLPPVLHAPAALVGRQLRLVGVGVDPVRIDPNTQLGDTACELEEPRLQPHGKENQRKGRGTNRLRRDRGIGLRDRETGPEEGAVHGSRYPAGLISRLAWIATRAGRLRVRAAMAAEVVPQAGMPPGRGPPTVK